MADSYNASDAATSLGVSVPTLKRMVKGGAVEGFRTPGGHLRVTAETIEAVKNQQEAKARPVREASSVLQNRRERIEELALEAQEHRAKRDLAKLEREEDEEADRQEAEAQAREEKIAQRQAEIELECQRLELEKARDKERREREQAEEWVRREAEKALAEFRTRWMDKAKETLAAYQYIWLTAIQLKEILEFLEAEIEKRQPHDEPRMAAILARGLAALVEPLKAERDAQARRQSITKQVLWNLTNSATEAEKVRAGAAIREALKRLDLSATDCEIRVAADEAIKQIRQAVEKRELDVRILKWAVFALPWHATDGDRARVRRECAEILAGLPLDISDTDARDALEPTIAEARREIERKQVEAQRQARTASLIQQGIAEVSSYLLELKCKGRLSDEDYWDSEFTAELRESVRRHLDWKLSGDETGEDVRKLTRKIIDNEIT
ncbi:MAG TPA: hypothetical protein VKV95_04475 [Terriglobia bacterium]|nr:hypothetical protein [Terriglobia bacterium]